MMNRSQQQGMPQRKSPSDQQRIARLGQGTVGRNVDIRIERQVDASGNEIIALVQVTFFDTDIPTKPDYKYIWRGTLAGFARMVDLFDTTLDAIEGKADLPVHMSDYDTRSDRSDRK